LNIPSGKFVHGRSIKKLYIFIITRHYQSCVSNDRNVPSDLIALSSKAKYITLPIEPNFELDQSLASDQRQPNGDETAKNDARLGPDLTNGAGLSMLPKDYMKRKNIVNEREVIV
jgi:hypothetical protein